MTDPGPGRIRAAWPIARAVVAVVTLIVAAAMPDQEAAVKVIGAGLVVIGATEIVGRTRSPGTGPAPLAIIPHSLLVIVGIALLVLPHMTLTAASRIAGILVIARALLHVVIARPDRLADARRAWVIASGALEASVGLLLLMSPGVALTVIGVAFVAMWVLAGILAALRMARRVELPTEPGDEVHGLFLVVMDRLARRPFPPADRDEIDGSLFFEGAERSVRIRSFAVMLGLATAIATWGLLQASTATVIGAMLVAPLMTPIMGLAASVVTGRPRRAFLSALTVLAGAVFVIALAAILSLVAPGAGDPATNPEVQARTAPPSWTSSSRSQRGRWAPMR